MTHWFDIYHNFSNNFPIILFVLFKSQLRNRLITELQETAGQAGLAQYDQPPVTQNLCELVANSLVADHLKRCKYEYSLSVFLPESGVQENKVNNVLFK